MSAARSATKIMAAIFGSRILGLVREVVLNNIFGPGRVLDAYYAAFRIPNLLRDLFAEGALSTAFVTTFSKKLEIQGKEEAFRLANLVLTALLLFMTAVVLLGMALSEPIVHLTNPGFFTEPGKGELTITLTRMLFPFILFVSLAAVYMGLLNSLGSFGLPASASSAFNVVSILAGLALGWWIDPSFGPRSILGFTVGTVIGGIAQLLIQVPRAMRLGLRLRLLLDFADPGLRQVLTLMIPAVIGGSAVQINVLVNGFFASYLGDAAVSWLNNAFRLAQLPIGLFGVAVATVILPSASRSAAVSDLTAFRDQIQQGLRMTFFLSVPSAIGCAVLAPLLIRVIYERGAFTPEDTRQTAVALQAFCLGLAGYSGIKVLAPAFYALDSPRIPLRVSLFGIVLNILLNLVFLKWLGLGLAGLPLATSLVALLNFAQLAWQLRLRLEGLGGGDFKPAIAKMLLSSALMGLVLWGFLPLLPAPSGFFSAAFSLATAIVAGAGLYFLLCAAFHLPELSAASKVMQRLRRK